MLHLNKKNMKKLIAVLLTVGTLSVATAQDQKTPPPANGQEQPKGPKPEMMASRHSKHLQKQLGLSDEQTQKVYDAMLVRFNDLHAAREKAGPNADRKVLREQTKPVRQKFIQTMNGILTADQKTKWEAHRKQMKENRMKHRNPDGKGNPPAANGDIKKLADDDDGIDD